MRGERVASERTESGTLKIIICGMKWEEGFLLSNWDLAQRVHRVPEKTASSENGFDGSLGLETAARNSLAGT